MRSPNIAYDEKLDHIRLLALWWVIVFHSFMRGVQVFPKSPVDNLMPCTPLTVFVAEAHIAVPLFFALSGFLFARICNNKFLDYKAFYRNRFLRIYPLYLVAVMFGAVMYSSQSALPNLLASLLCLQVVTAGLAGQYIGHLWTISVEMQFYLIFPYLLLLYRKQGITSLATIMGLSIVALAIMLGSSQAVMQRAEFGSIFGCINQFLLGMIGGLYFQKLKRIFSSPLAIPITVLCTLAALTWVHSLGGIYHANEKPLCIFWPTIAGLCATSAILSYSASNLQLPKSLSKFLADCGAITYSGYVVHFPLSMLLVGWFGGILNTDHHCGRFVLHLQQWLCVHLYFTSALVGTFLVLPATLGISYFTFRLIEKPFIDMRTRYAFDLNAAEADLQLGNANKYNDLPLPAIADR